MYHRIFSTFSQTFFYLYTCVLLHFEVSHKNKQFLYDIISMKEKVKYFSIVGYSSVILNDVICEQRWRDNLYNE